MRSEVALQSKYARAAAPSHKSSEERLPTLSRTSRGGEENNDAHQCGTAPGQKGPMSSCLWRVDLPTKGSYRLTYSTSFFHILRETETRNGNINGTWQQVVSAGKGFPRTWHRCLGAIPGQPCLSSPFTPMLVCLYLGPNTASMRGLSKRRRGGVVGSVEFSNIGICIIRVSSDDPRLDTDRCSMSLDDSRASTVETHPRRRSRTRFRWFR